MSDLNVMENVPGEVVAMVRLPMEVRKLAALAEVLTEGGKVELYMKGEPKGWLMIHGPVVDGGGDPEPGAGRKMGGEKWGTEEGGGELR